MHAPSRCSGAQQSRPRRAHKKSKTGCQECKRRKIKCGEERPVCRRCVVRYEFITECDYGRRDASDSSSADKADEAERPAEAPGAQPMAPRPAKRVLSKRDALPQPRSISPHMIDPFHSHPPCREPDIDMLMEAYFRKQVFNVLPYYPTRKVNPVVQYYVPLIWTDTVLFHVTLLLSAFELERKASRRDRLRSKRLTQECISLLQDRVNSSGSGCTSDETLCAIAGLAAVEHEKGNSRLVQMHMNGLRRILDVRGGFRAIRRSNATVANVVWCIFVAAADDAFPECDLEGPVERPAWFFDAFEKDASEPRVDFAASGVYFEHADIMWNIRILAKTYQTADDCANAKEYQEVMTFLTATLQRLLALPMPSPLNTYEARITAACRHALVIHIFALWCDHQPDPSLMVSVAQHNLLLVLKPLVAYRVSNQLLLWLLSVGATGRFGQAERNWFVNQLANVADDLGIRSWPEMRSNLQQVIWHEHQDEEQHRELWEEVEQRQESEEEV